MLPQVARDDVQLPEGEIKWPAVAWTKGNTGPCTRVCHWWEAEASGHLHHV